MPQNNLFFRKSKSQVLCNSCCFFYVNGFSSTLGVIKWWPWFCKVNVLCVYFTAIWLWRSISGQRPSLALVFSLVLAISLLSIIYFTSHCNSVFVQEPNPFFVSSVWPVHISGNQNQSPAPGGRRPTSPGRSHLPGVISGGLVVLIHIPWHIFCLSLKSRWNVGQRVHCIHYIFLAFPFFHFPLVSSAFYSFPENIAQLFPNLKPITES